MSFSACLVRNTCPTYCKLPRQSSPRRAKALHRSSDAHVLTLRDSPRNLVDQPSNQNLGGMLMILQEMYVASGIPCRMLSRVERELAAKVIDRLYTRNFRLPQRATASHDP
jgi:hypothetical protein